MRLNRITLTVSLLAPLALAAPGVIAKDEYAQKHDHDRRQHDAHVHGIAALNLALEGDEVHVELDSPAANIVGYEHPPSSEADHAVLDKAVAALKDGDRLFRFNSQARCRMEKVQVSSALLDQEHGEHGDEHADGHGHEKKDAHAHDDQRHEEHGHEGHDHEEHGGETHADIDAAYHFECDRPGKLTQLTVDLFEVFPGMEKLNVQYVIESKQGAAELTPATRVVIF